MRSLGLKVAGIFLFCIPLLGNPERPVPVDGAAENGLVPIPMPPPASSTAIVPEPGGGGGGGGADVPPPVVLRLSEPPVQRNGTPRERIRFSVIRSQHDLIFRNNSIFDSGRELQNRAQKEIDEQILSLNVAIHELENEVIVMKYEHEMDKAWLVQTKELFALAERLFKKEAITKNQFLEDKARFEKTTAKVEQSYFRYLEAERESDLLKLRKKQLQGETITLTQIAEGIAALWEARVGKMKYAGKFAQSEVDLLTLLKENSEALYMKKAGTYQDVLLKTRAAKEAQLVLEMSQTLEKQNQQYYEEALDNVKKVKAQGK